MLGPRPHAILAVMRSLAPTLIVVALLAACGPRKPPAANGSPAAAPAPATCREAMAHVVDVSLAAMSSEDRAAAEPDAQAALPDLIANCESVNPSPEKLRCAMAATTVDQLAECDGGWDSLDRE